MGKNIFYILLIFLSNYIIAQSNYISDKYSDKFKLAKDIIAATQKRDITKINFIASQLNIPYSLYKTKIFPLYEKKNDIKNSFPKDEMYPDSWYIKDSNAYNKYATNFYYSNFIESILNDSDNDTTYSNTIYVAFDKTDSIFKNELRSNYLGIFYENENTVKVIDIETLATLNNVLYNLRKINFYSYPKTELPQYLIKKMPDNIVVYKLIDDAFVEQKNSTILFSNVNYTNNNYEIKDIDILTDSTTQISKDLEILEVVEEMPSFPNGITGLQKYLKENLRYPKEAQKKKIEGKVILRFVVEKNGSVKDAIVVKDVTNGTCIEEALRLVQKMPKWWPAKQDGKAVRVYYTLPINFSLKN